MNVEIDDANLVIVFICIVTKDNLQQNLLWVNNDNYVNNNDTYINLLNVDTLVDEILIN